MVGSVVQASKNLLHQCAERWEQRLKKREKNIQGVREGKIAEIEPQERIEKRLNHLSEVAQKASFRERRVNLSEGFQQDIGLERVIGGDDFLGIDFLELGLAVSRSVCKVNIFRSPGRSVGSGSGFMVGPNLVMTNNHVLPNDELARFSILEFDYQLDKYGQPMNSVRFALDPDEFFVTDELLDYTIVAVNRLSDNNRPIAAYGWNKLMDEGKALIGDPLNIVQHPNGGYKQIVLQSNELIDLLPIHAHYLTDTEPGSSGSLVCNNQWEVVALHHAGVPKRVNGVIMDVHDRPWDGLDPDDIQWVANEGIRISRILRHLENVNVPVEWEATRRSILESTPPDPLELSDQFMDRPEDQTTSPAPVHGGKSISWTIPLNVTVSIGEVEEGARPANASTSIASDSNGALGTGNGMVVPVVEKRVVPFIESDYTNRKGYDEEYLGVKVPMPELVDDSKASKMDNGEFVIPYHNFSTVVNKDRRMAYFCAANVDANEESKEPEKDKDYSRKGLGGLGPNDHEAWLTDPRIPEVHQLPDRFYNKDRKSFDKGHIIRREDVAWGDTYDEVRAANGDTFHATNCSPQVAQYNRSNLGGIWGKFENFVLDEAEDEKLIVFSGPLFRINDRFFDGWDDRGKIRVKIPRGYWKIIVCRDGDTVKTYAFIFNQSLRDVNWDEVAVIPDEFEKFQCKVSELQNKLDNVRLPELLLTTDQKT